MLQSMSRRIKSLRVMMMVMVTKRMKMNGPKRMKLKRIKMRQRTISMTMVKHWPTAMIMIMIMTILITIAAANQSLNPTCRNWIYQEIRLIQWIQMGSPRPGNGCSIIHRNRPPMPMRMRMGKINTKIMSTMKKNQQITMRKLEKNTRIDISAIHT